MPIHCPLKACAAILLGLTGCAQLPATAPAAAAAAPAAACRPAPLGATTLFLRGGMNNWNVSEEHAFTYSCDAYYLNVNLEGKLEFKLADAAWTKAVTYGAGKGAPASLDAGQALPLSRATDPAGAGNLSHVFGGGQTLKLEFDGAGARLAVGPKSFNDPNDAAVSDPLALSVAYDSRQAADKSPYGAAPAGSMMTFALSALPGVTGAVMVVERRRLEGNQEVLEYTEVARLPMTPGTAGAAGGRQRWSSQYRFADKGVYGYYFELLINGQSYRYQNNRDSIHWTREKGSNGLGLVQHSGASAERVRRFRQTVYAPDFVVPAWARDVVYYYIFPERFRNGDQGNDPRPGVDRFQDKPVEFHRNWLELPYHPNSGDGSDPYDSNDFFGGDLQGIIDKLDYIAELGANAIYMTPVFQAASNHKYDAADYKNIDRHFGSNADFARLTAAAGKRGIRVVTDASLNHTGADSVYFDRYSKYGGQGAFAGARVNPASPYASWYSFDPGQADPDLRYTGWTGVSNLPELNKASPAWREYAYRAPDSVTRLWLDRGAAGWRMDVAPWVPDDFWREWRSVVKQHKPDALTIAETWFDSSKYLLGDSFDTTMNYIFRNALLDYANGAKAAKAYQNIELMREAYPPQSFYALMNLLSTHDQARSLHLFGDHGAGSSAAAVQLAKQRLRLAVFFQMMFPGAPAVYYGDEVGLTGGDDPANRATYPWADQGGKPDLALLGEFKRLIKMRKDHPVLRHGSIEAPLLLDDNVVVLARRDGASWAICATNNGAAARTVTVTLPAGAAAAYADALSGARVSAAGGRLTLTVPAMYGAVLVSR